MHEVTLSSKFQLSIPKAIRERLHLQAGQRFIFVTRGDTIALVPRRELAELRGSLRGANTDDVRDRQDRI